MLGSVLWFSIIALHQPAQEFNAIPLAFFDTGASIGTDVTGWSGDGTTAVSMDFFLAF
jgi:hypothetical protein